MDSTSQQINKKTFSLFFTTFILLAALSIIFYVYTAIIGLENNWGNEGILLIVPVFLILCLYLGIIILFTKLLIANKKRDNKKIFLTISIIAIFLEITQINYIFTIYKEERNSMNYENLTKQECALAKNAMSYKDCSDMTTYCIQTCASIVNEKTGDLQGCINLSIDYAKKGTKCLHGGYAKDNPDCLKGFSCLKKNDYKIDGTNKDSLWIGYADGTYKCEVGPNNYCPTTEQ